MLCLQPCWLDVVRFAIVGVGGCLSVHNRVFVENKVLMSNVTVKETSPAGKAGKDDAQGSSYAGPTIVSRVLSLRVWAVL
jgi:hypothetical protein